MLRIYTLITVFVSLDTSVGQPYEHVADHALLSMDAFSRL